MANPKTFVVKRATPAIPTPKSDDRMLNQFLQNVSERLKSLEAKIDSNADNLSTLASSTDGGTIIAPPITETLDGDVNFKGFWDASQPNPPSTIPAQGDYWVVSVNGTTNLSGINSWTKNDWVVWDGLNWTRLKNFTISAGANITLTPTDGNIQIAATSAISDGDKGDITVSGGGAVWNIDAGVVGATELAAVLDLSAKTSLAIPSDAAPVVNSTGEIALDTSVTDFSHGIPKIYGGEELAFVVVPIAQLSSPADGDVIQYDATADEFVLSPPDTGPYQRLASDTATGGGVSDLTAVSFNLSSHDVLEIEFSIGNASGFPIDISLFVNGDTTATNYYTQKSIFSNTTATNSRDNNAELFSVPSGIEVAGTIKLYRSAQGLNVRGICTFNVDYPNAIEQGMTSWVWGSSVDITDLALNSNTALAIADGSYMRVFQKTY